jgi:hypothetical protein
MVLDQEGSGMSADNWDTCPKCFHRATVAAEKEAAFVQAQYGKVPVEDFDRMRATLIPVNANDFRTFREDYEVGIDDGAVYVDYRGSCSTCGLKATMKETQPFWSPDAA